MKVVIDIEEEAGAAALIRMLKDAQRRQREEPMDHWIDLETPFMCLHVPEIIGVISEDDMQAAETYSVITPLGAL